VELACVYDGCEAFEPDGAQRAFCRRRSQRTAPGVNTHATGISPKEGLERAVTGVRFPQIRQGLVDALAVLADPEYQRRVWLEHQSDERGSCYTWDMAVHALFDDSGLVDPGFEVDGVFRSDEEDAAVRAVMDAIDEVFAEVGTTEAPIQEIVRSSAWQQVVERARQASALIEGIGPEPG
jgi:hypothetical protein